jgi:hypothetical protein
MRRLVALGMISFTLTVAPCLRADPADEEAARALFREGLALHEKANYAAALEKFYAAYAKWKNPKILANIGTAAWELGRYPEAANAYDQFLAEAPPQDPSRAEVERARADVLRRVGTLKILHDANSGTLTVDGVAAPPAKLAQMRVNPGHHNVELKRSNGSRVAHGVDVAAGATVQVDIRQDQPRSIILSTAPTTTTTTATLSLPPATSPDSGGQASKPRGPIDPVPWIIGGVGVGALIASGVLWNLRGKAVDDLADDCIGDTCPESSQDDIDDANRYGLFSLIALGVGVAGVGTGTYLLLRGGSAEKKEPKGPTTQIGFAATPLGAAGSVRVEF